MTTYLDTKLARESKQHRCANFKDNLSNITFSINSLCQKYCHFLSFFFALFLCRFFHLREMSLAAKTVCVTGASGYIASWLVKFLLNRGYTVKASVRDPSLYLCYLFLYGVIWVWFHLMEKWGFGFVIFCGCMEKEKFLFGSPCN